MFNYEEALTNVKIILRKWITLYLFCLGDLVLSTFMCVNVGCYSVSFSIDFVENFCWLSSQGLWVYIWDEFNSTLYVPDVLLVHVFLHTGLLENWEQRKCFKVAVRSSCMVLSGLLILLLQAKQWKTLLALKNSPH